MEQKKTFFKTWNQMSKLNDSRKLFNFQNYKYLFFIKIHAPVQ